MAYSKKLGNSPPGLNSGANKSQTLHAYGALKPELRIAGFGPTAFNNSIPAFKRALVCKWCLEFWQELLHLTWRHGLKSAHNPYYGIASRFRTGRWNSSRERKCDNILEPWKR